MSAINVRRDVKDSYYRYKMPRLISKVEGKGNGIKTVIPNMTDIARALSRPPSYPTKYFGCELGAQVKCDDKNERYIVNGEHDAEKLQQILDGFISKFVLCDSCKNPETDIIIKNDDILMDCKACGARNLADMRHKLSTFILKNPPAAASKNLRKQRKAATAQANGTDENGMPNGHDDGAASDDDIISQRINKEAAGLSLESQLAEEDWSEDTSEEAVAQRMKELSVKGMGAFGGDDEDDGENKYEQFGEWLDSEENPSDDAIVEKAEELGVFGKYKACQVLVQCIFDETIAAQIPKRTKLLRRFVKDEKHQKAVLGGMERLVGLEYKDKLIKKVPAILMKLYDADIIEDDVFLKWGEKPSKRYVEREVSKEVKKAAKPFLEWLENASEEESDEESD
ncbi:domain found in IF2B/IF5-domain-containing protein [Radiomyces spectabilis]|uniref:domain found in IF2B/IF5-domain-containing protein n=1 Tax=Radiomyces spectabilis TaxID=64574 RepID=UPI00221F7E01|nr:domain found in IF2B/IF5-domain-containing protein [Radiomyces spectabilis]KAI8373064.1 domain found in IF2B/IF5-domain-containing protein [Radiomyces spectabilis]